MNWLRRILGKSGRRETELDAELRFHVRKVAEAKMAQGISAEEARREALLEFGGGEQVKEECRDVYRLATVENALANGKAAWRFIRRSPTFAATVVCTLALGIGANSAVFSAIDAILLRPLPFPDANQLVVLYQHDVTAKSPTDHVAPVRVEDWNRLSKAFSSISGYYQEDSSETSGRLPERLEQGLIAPRFFRTLGVTPELGRDFTAEEERFGGPNVTIISDRYWRRRFHADPNVVGKALRFGKASIPIIGVIPASVTLPDKQVDYWSVSAPDAPYSQDRASTWFIALGRLKHGVTLEQGRADLSRVQADLGRAFPKTDQKLVPVVEPLKSSIVGETAGRSLWLLFGSVSLLLLIACTNIATLLLARTAERAREIAIRYSLGASRASVILQLLTESLALAVLGSVAGLFVAWGATQAFHLMAKTLPRADEISLDWRLVVYALGCSLVATLLFGLIPAVQATRRSIAGSLAGQGRTQVAGGSPLQWLLVGVQVALAVTLLVGSALLLRSFQALGRVAAGFDASHVLAFEVSASWGETVDRKGMAQRIENDLNAVRSVPGVESAATSFTLPGMPDQFPSEFQLLDGHGSTDKIASDSRAVSDGYFATMRIPVLAGVPCSAQRQWTDVVVNRRFAETYLPGQTVVGRHFKRGQFDTTDPVIAGVVGDAREGGLNRAPGPLVYSCANDPSMAPHFLARTKGDPGAMAGTIRRAMQKIEPGRSVFHMVPLTESLYEASAETRFRTWLLSLFALTAIALAAIGLYGTLSYFVGLRRREVGLRIALGAMPGQILQKFLRQGLWVAALGCGAGLALAAFFSRAVATMLFGVSRVDFASYAGVAGLMLAVASVASVIPAARAARLDPMRVLREE